MANLIYRPASIVPSTGSTRRKNLGQTQQNIGENNSVSNKKLLTADTDSVNENFSPVRPSTKRKRKFKRMALDPDNTVVSMESSATKSKTGTIKRKKVRSKSACENRSSSPLTYFVEKVAARWRCEGLGLFCDLLGFWSTF